jgi:FHA domain
MFGAKKCPNCGQPQEKNWDKCPFCINMGSVGGGGMAMGGQAFPPPGPPPGGYGGFPPPQGYGAAPPMPAPQRTVALMTGAGPVGGQQQLGWLVPLKGPHRGELLTLKPLSVIGKDPGCDVVFNDPFMSGRHATIRAQPNGFVLEDHSTNGTFVNDKKIKTHELVDSDFVKFGQTLVKFKAL